MFEIKYSDLAGRIGVLHTNHGKIETPSFVPVIHPVKQTIPAKKIKENAGSEVLGVIANDSITSFGKEKCFEVDATDKTPEIILKRIQDIINNQENSDIVDWLKLIEEKNEMNKFFDY